MNPLFRIDFSISDSLKIVRKSVLIYETIIHSMWDMFNAWYQQAEKLESGEITKEEYDQWRYTYPKMGAEQTRQELDALREKRKAENNTD